MFLDENGVETGLGGNLEEQKGHFRFKVSGMRWGIESTDMCFEKDGTIYLQDPF